MYTRIYILRIIYNYSKYRFTCILMFTYHYSNFELSPHGNKTIFISHFKIKINI